MKNIRSGLFNRLVFFPLGGLITISTVCSIPQTVYSVPSLHFEDSPKEIVDDVWQIVNTSFVDETFHHTDWAATRRQLLSKNYTSKKQAYDAIRAALKTLDDPYTAFLDPQEYAELNQHTSGELSGIGAKLTMDKTTKALTVMSAMAESPALKAGVKSGDRIVSIDGKLTQGMSIEKAVSLIRGKPNTTVKLMIARPGQKNFELAITRQVVQVPTVTYAMKREGANRIGYIRLSEFDAHAETQIRQAITVLNDQKVNSFILDLRDNPGGLLDAAVGISRLWLNSGTIVNVKERTGSGENITANNTAITRLPLSILVDGGSASASEILTGALKDNKRSIVVGTKTFGKGLVQSVRPLGDGSAVKVTIAHYFTPNGTDINHKGIMPDVVVSLTKEQREKLSKNPDLLASPADPQYVKAVQSISKLSQAIPQK